MQPKKGRKCEKCHKYNDSPKMFKTCRACRAKSREQYVRRAIVKNSITRRKVKKPEHGERSLNRPYKWGTPTYKIPQSV